jgi:hypothetical protein
MTYSTDFLIQKRKEIWNTRHDIEFDKEFRLAVANEIVNNRSLLYEVIEYPEKLIELVFVVVDKKKKTIPFFLNEVQNDFISVLNKSIKDFEKGIIPEISIVILKGRQQGFTTLITAYQLACCITNRNFEGFTLADEGSNTEAIFQNKAKFVYNQLPDKLKPTEKFNNRRQLLFSKLNSSWSVDTATKDVGRSRTINFFHGSECAFWKDGISPIQAGLGQAFTPDCIKIYESTANGYNDYQKMWESGEHIRCFYGWWRTPEYRINFPGENVRIEFDENINTKSGWIWERLQWLRDEIHLEPEQLYWYYKKFRGYIDGDMIKQEYPCTPEEAFLVSGKPVFDTEKLIARIAVMVSPIKRGYFTYSYDGMKISNIKWVSDRNGPINIYRLPNSPEVTKYCIGGDTAGEGSDYFTAHVLDAKTGEQVACLKHQYDPDQYTRQMYCLGMYYKYALIGIETNFDTYPVRELERLGYDNQYVRENLDDYTNKLVKSFGFKTTVLTRPTIISNLIEIVRDHTNLINDKDTADELLTIVKNKKGRIEAPEGMHDDQMMGLAIAYHVREQVTFDEEAMQMNRQDEFHIQSEKSVKYEYDDYITVI